MTGTYVVVESTLVKNIMYMKMTRPYYKSTYINFQVGFLHIFGNKFEYKANYVTALVSIY